MKYRAALSQTNSRHLSYEKKVPDSGRSCEKRWHELSLALNYSTNYSRWQFFILWNTEYYWSAISVSYYLLFTNVTIYVLASSTLTMHKTDMAKVHTLPETRGSEFVPNTWCIGMAGPLFLPHPCSMHCLCEAPKVQSLVETKMSEAPFRLCVLSPFVAWYRTDTVKHDECCTLALLSSLTAKICLKSVTGASGWVCQTSDCCCQILSCHQCYLKWERQCVATQQLNGASLICSHHTVQSHSHTPTVRWNQSSGCTVLASAVQTVQQQDSYLVCGLS